MIIAAVIRHENQILLQQKSEINNQIIWELPNCEITDVDNQINLLVEKCKTLNVTIETTDIFFDNESNNQRCIVYNTELRSLSYSSSSGCWIDAKDLKNLSFSKQFDGAISKLVHEYDIIISFLSVNDSSYQFLSVIGCRRCRKIWSDQLFGLGPQKSGNDSSYQLNRLEINYRLSALPKNLVGSVVRAG